jgi:hypothetical protein
LKSRIDRSCCVVDEHPIGTDSRENALCHAHLLKGQLCATIQYEKTDHDIDTALNSPSLWQYFLSHLRREAQKQQLHVQ